MKITVLGSGGNCTIPWIMSNSKVSREARIKGGRYVRTCPSFFVHDLNLLIESPETIFSTLDRENIQEVDHLFLSHPHPDHTYGLRFVQSNMDYQAMKPKKCIPLYMGEESYRRFSTIFYPSVTHFANRKLIKPVLMHDREEIRIGNINITWYCANKVENNDVFVFLFKDGGKKVLFALDDVHNLELLPEFENIDVLIHECGWFDYKPNGEILFYNPHKRWSEDIKFDETIERIKKLRPEKTYLMNLEEVYERSYDHYLELEERYKELNIAFCYDGMKIEL